MKFDSEGIVFVGIPLYLCIVCLYLVNYTSLDLSIKALLAILFIVSLSGLSEIYHQFIWLKNKR
jgi:hypothetical protein